MPTGKLPFRKREVAMALALGGVAALGAGTMLEVLDDEDRRHGEAVQEAGHGSLTYEVAPFDEIVVTGPHDVIVTLGDTMAVKAQGPQDLLQRFEAVVEDGRLLIRPRDGESFAIDTDFDELTFTVSLPRLERLTLEGSGDVTVDRVDGPQFDAVLSGSGDMTIGLVRSDRASFSLTGSGDIEAAGYADSVTYSVEGSGTINAAALVGNAATVSLVGSGDIELTATDTANVTMTGSGDVEVNGPAACTISATGTGDVSCYGTQDVR